MSSIFSRLEDYVNELTDRFRADNEVNRREERRIEEEAVLNNAVGGDEQVRIESVDFKERENAVNHHCEKYELVTMKKAPVFRRGGLFTFDIKLSAEVDLKRGHVLKLYFNNGPKPSPHKATQAVLNVSGKTQLNKNHQQWDVRTVQQQGTIITLEAQIPTDAPIGLWKCAVEIYRHNPPSTPDPARHLLRLETLIYILFNPWNKHDSTHLAEEEQRQEYVLTDIGKIWQGSFPYPRGRHWVFGQFDDAVLPACILLLERSGIRAENRGDPIQVSRAISKIVNSNQDNGVVVGKWDGEYSDGTSPSAWTGSIKILEQYLRTSKPVKYGQCWVFAGVVNTVCRALGLPARVISNFNSAHDTDVSLTIDEYFDQNGEEIKQARPGLFPMGLHDSIWNFHVWNEVWMDRPDLPVGFGGWQVIDATPQELSSGSYQCGPASLEAVRRGQMELNYDVPFVLAEVNADVVKWQEDSKAQDGFRKLYSSKTHVGRILLTKKVGAFEDSGSSSNDLEDLTTVYKPPEGSHAERVTLHTAARRSRNARHAFRFPSEAIEDVDFVIQDVLKINIGEDFNITVRAQNVNEKEDRTITILLRAGSTYYTGAPAHHITSAEGTFTLKPKEDKTLTLPVPYKKYYHKLVEHAMIKMVAHCTVKETSYAWTDDDCFEVSKPEITVEVMSGKLEVGGQIVARFSFTNPLPEALIDGSLVVDGPGLLRPKTIPIGDVLAGRQMTYDLNIYPTKPGNHTLVATFNSTQLLNLTGSTQITIN